MVAVVERQGGSGLHDGLCPPLSELLEALPGTDDGASQPGNPTNASEQSQRSRRVMRPTDKRNLWPGLWRLMPEWREIVIQNNGVSKFFGSDAHMAAQE